MLFIRQLTVPWFAFGQNGHVRQLRRFLAAIRGPFLDVSRRLAGSLDARPVTVTFPAIHSGTGPAPAPKSVVVTSLSDREKDEMEIELKKYTKICAGQVQNLRKYIGWAR